MNNSIIRRLLSAFLIVVFAAACAAPQDGTAPADEQPSAQPITLGCQLPAQKEMVQHLAIQLACENAASTDSVCITTNLNATSCEATVDVSSLPEGITQATLTLKALTMGDQPTESIPTFGMTKTYPRGTLPTGIENWTCVQSGQYLLCNPVNLDFVEGLSQ